MTDWGIDLAGWEQGAKATAAILDALNKLRHTLSRRKKATQPEDKRELDKEIDALEANLLQVVGQLMKFLESHEKFMRAILEAGPKSMDSLIQLINQFGVVNRLTANLADIAPDHERRLKALEQRAEGRGKRAPKPEGRRGRKKPKR
jgi:hypothetical protein